jgi:outer membrane receptor for ferrienterochelin and colicins
MHMKHFGALSAVSLVLAFAHSASGAPAPADTTQDRLETLLSQRVEAAAKYDQSIHDAAASVTIVTAEEIERYGYRTIDDVLRTVRSFYISNDRNYAYAGMRGFGRPGDYNNRILLLLDGHAMNDNVYGAAAIGTEWGGIDLRTIERIEIVRGPGSSLYGANAMLAVINLVSKTPNGMSSLRLDVESGTHGYVKAGAALARALGSDVQLSLSGQASHLDGADLYFPQYDDPTTNNGVAHDLDWDHYYDVQGKVSAREFQVQAMWASRDKGIPTGAWGVDFNDPRAHTLDEHAFIDAQYQHAFGANRSILARAYANRYTYEGGYPTGGVDVEDASDGRWFGLELRHLWDIRSNNRLVVGLEAQKHTRSDYRLWNDGVPAFDRNVAFEVLSGYAQEEVQPTSWLSLMLGMRLDNYSDYDAAGSPRAAVIVNPAPSATLKLLYGEAYRVPTFYERYYEDPATDYKANDNLQPEVVNTYEIVWEQDIAEGLAGTVSLFRNEFDGLIDTAFDPADSMFVNRNLIGARAQGFELELRGSAAFLSGYASYSHQEAKDANRDWLTNSPHHLAKFGVMVPVRSFLRCGIESQYESQRLTVYGTETDPFFLTNLNFTTTFHPFSTQATASLLIRNVFDEKYATPGGFEHAQPAIEQDGRTIVVGLGARF